MHNTGLWGYWVHLFYVDVHGDFDLSEVEDFSEGESVEEPSEAQVEKLLLDNLSSSESEDEIIARPKKRRYVACNELRAVEFVRLCATSYY